MLVMVLLALPLAVMRAGAARRVGGLRLAVGAPQAGGERCDYLRVCVALEEFLRDRRPPPSPPPLPPFCFLVHT